MHIPCFVRYLRIGSLPSYLLSFGWFAIYLPMYPPGAMQSPFFSFSRGCPPSLVLSFATLHYLHLHSATDGCTFLYLVYTSDNANLMDLTVYGYYSHATRSLEQSLSWVPRRLTLQRSTPTLSQHPVDVSCLRLSIVPVLSRLQAYTSISTL